MSVVQDSRAIFSLLQTLMGPYSSGQMLVKSTGPTGNVPKFAHAIPIIGASLIEEAIVRVEPNPATEDGSWNVVNSGTLIPIASVQGGNHVNQPAGTTYRWDSPIDGIEAVSVCPSGMSGGSKLTTGIALQQLREYRSVGGPRSVKEIFAAGVGSFPAAVLAWAADMPNGGSVSTTSGANSSRAGRGSRIFKHEWHLFLISNRFDSSTERSHELDRLRDDVLSTLSDRTAFRGQAISGPQGIEILESSVASITPTSYVDLIRFTTSYSLRMKELSTYSDWKRSNVQTRTSEQGTPAARIIITNDTLVM